MLETLYLRELINGRSTAWAIEGSGFVTVLAGQFLGPLVELVAPDAELQRKFGCRFLAKLEQPHGFELEFLGVTRAHALGVLLGSFHLTPPWLLSPFKSVRKTRVSSVCPL